jgi:hypothetical protein
MFICLWCLPGYNQQIMGWLSGWMPSFGPSVLWIWIITIILFGLDGVAIGYALNARRSGIFINERKLMSLSRVQVALWSLLILSAIFTILVMRLWSGVKDPINIGVDIHIWALIGISLGSLAGRTAIMGKKGAAEPVPAKMDTAARKASINLREGISPGDPDAEKERKITKNAETIKNNAVGALYANASINDANIMDMFQGDEVGNTWVVDIGKVQMFFFTVITIATYAAAIWAMLASTPIGALTSMPPMSDGFVAVLGVSHAGLLANSSTTQMPIKQP